MNMGCGAVHWLGLARLADTPCLVPATTLALCNLCKCKCAIN